MALAPARTKYRKWQKGSRAGNAKRGNVLSFGEYGLQSLTRGPMTGAQIEALKAEPWRGLALLATPSAETPSLLANSASNLSLVVP